jgi:hypothetical protein
MRDIILISFTFLIIVSQADAFTKPDVVNSGETDKKNVFASCVVHLENVKLLSFEQCFTSNISRQKDEKISYYIYRTVLPDSVKYNILSVSNSDSKTEFISEPFGNANPYELELNEKRIVLRFSGDKKTECVFAKEENVLSCVQP